MSFVERMPVVAQGVVVVRVASAQKKRNRKGKRRMKIAVTYDQGQVFQHFGHTAQFKIYQEDGGKVLSSQVVDTNGTGHGALAGFLKDLGVDVLICGGARAALNEADIALYGGVSGDADQAVEEFLDGKLHFDPAAECNHHHGEHHHHHHGDGHNCGHGDHACHHGSEGCK